MRWLYYMVVFLAGYFLVGVALFVVAPDPAAGFVALAGGALAVVLVREREKTRH